MSETNNLYLNMLLSGIIIIISYNYYITQTEYSLLKDEHLLLKTKLTNYGDIKSINGLLLKQNKELTDENKLLQQYIGDLKEKNNNLINENNNLINENNNLINENNENNKKNNKNILEIPNEEQYKLLFEDELATECYDHIPCNNIKKRTNFFW